MIKIFISSVQSEFSKERKMLYDYISNDAMLGRFFQPFIFEKLPAKSRKPDDVYLKEASKSDIYPVYSVMNTAGKTKKGSQQPKENMTKLRRMKSLE